MKKTLLRDFLLKLTVCYLVAFAICFIITFNYFKHKVIESQLDSMKGISQMLVKHEFDGRINCLKEEFKVKKADILEQDVNLYKALTGADILVAFDRDGKVLKQAGLTLTSVAEEDFFPHMKGGEEVIQTFHYIPRSHFKTETFLNGRHVTDRILLYSAFYKLTPEGPGALYVWAGFILNDRKDLLNNLTYFGIDTGFIWDGEKVIAAAIDQTAVDPSQVKLRMKRESAFLAVTARDYKIFMLGDDEYIGKEIMLRNIKSETVARLVTGRKTDFVNGLLRSYAFSVAGILFFSSCIGVMVIVLYFRGIFDFLGQIHLNLAKLGKQDFTASMDTAVKTEEYKDISRDFNLMNEGLQRYYASMEQEIRGETRKILDLSKAIRSLDEQITVQALVSCGRDFVEGELGYKVLPAEECPSARECDGCRYRLMSIVIENEERGFCVDMTAGTGGSLEEEFMHLFEEVLRVNAERIVSQKSSREIFLEANYISDVLASLLEKRNAHEIFMFILDKAREYCRSDAAYIGIYDSKDHAISLKFFSNIHSEEFKKLRFSADIGLAGLVLRDRKTVFVENYYEDPRLNTVIREVIGKEGLPSIIAVPIMHREEIFGILYIAYRNVTIIGRREIPFLEKLANVAALALEKETLIVSAVSKEEELRLAYDEIISKRKEIGELLKNYKEANTELERTNREISEQYEIVRKSYEELNRLNKAKDVFLGILSHELNTPIAILNGYMDTLLAGKFQHQSGVGEIVQACKKTVINLSRVVEDLLDYSRIEMKRLAVRKMPVNILTLMTSIREEIEPILKDRNQRFLVDIDNSITAEVDEKWFRRALYNIIINAIKFTPDGRSISVSGQVVSRNDMEYPVHVSGRPGISDNYLVIRVRDEGVGMPYSELSRIFEKFYEVGDIREHSTGTTAFMAKGLGLGLSFVRQIIELHKGVVFAESSGYDQKAMPGSSFSVCIPVGREALPEQAVEQDDRKWILIVESENEVSRFLELVFSQKFHLHIVSQGGLGYLKTVELQPDLVFININLADYDGYELCSVIKEDRNTKHIPVVLYSSGIDIFDEKRAESAKANMVFSPLFDIPNLQRIANHFTSRPE